MACLAAYPETQAAPVIASWRDFMAPRLTRCSAA